MGRITQILFENGINMNTLITNDSAEFGIIRMLVSDTDKGEELKRQVADLKELLYAYRHGFIKEKR
jgi:fructose-1,6-bisphosphatase-3